MPTPLFPPLARAIKFSIACLYKFSGKSISTTGIVKSLQLLVRGSGRVKRKNNNIVNKVSKRGLCHRVFHRLPV